MDKLCCACPIVVTNLFNMQMQNINPGFTYVTPYNVNSSGLNYTAQFKTWIKKIQDYRFKMTCSEFLWACGKKHCCSCLSFPWFFAWAAAVTFTEVVWHSNGSVMVNDVLVLTESFRSVSSSLAFFHLWAYVLMSVGVGWVTFILKLTDNKISGLPMESESQAVGVLNPI